MRLKMLCGLVFAALLFGVSPAQAQEGVSIPVQVGAGSTAQPQAADKVYCDGYAPVDATCRGSMVLTGNFDIVVAVANTFRGMMWIRGETGTGSVTIVCEQLFAPLYCEYEHAGFFMEGQTFTLTGVVPGMGYSIPSTAYWRIRIP